MIRNGQPGVVAHGPGRRSSRAIRRTPSTRAGCASAARRRCRSRITRTGSAAAQAAAATRGSGDVSAEISWDEAMAELVARLDALVGERRRPSLRSWRRPRRGRRQRWSSDSLAVRRAAAGRLRTVRRRRPAARQCAELRRDQLPTFDLARTRYVLGFGADFLGTWNSPVAQSAGYGACGRGSPAFAASSCRSKPRMSQTGASADEWVPVRPGTEGVLALGLAHVILQRQTAPGRARAAPARSSRVGAPGCRRSRRPRSRSSPAWRRRGRAAGAEFAAHGPAVAIIGGAPLAQTNGLFQALAVNALNALVGSVGRRAASLHAAAGAAGAARAIAARRCSARRPRRRCCCSTTPTRCLRRRRPGRCARRCAKCPSSSASGGSSTRRAPSPISILPDHSFLESWAESAPESGAARRWRPRPGRPCGRCYDTRATPDVLLDVGRRLKRPLDRRAVADLRGDAAGAAEAAPATAPASRATAAPAVAGTGLAPSRVSTATPSEYPFHFLPYARRRSTTARWRTCRGCRSCPIR